MSFITADKWEKNGVEVITFNNKKWLNKKHIEKQLKRTNLTYVSRQCPLKFRKERQ